MKVEITCVEKMNYFLPAKFLKYSTKFGNNTNVRILGKCQITYTVLVRR